MDDLATENLVLIDWVSITSKDLKLGDWINKLGLSRVPWEAAKGVRGYKYREYYDGINVHYDTQQSDYQTWLEMSGSGCRAFESYGNGDYARLFSYVRNNPGTTHFTRLDIAFDDHTGVLDIGRILQDVQEQNYVSRSREWECVISSKGRSCVIGSATSDVRIRIYDKAAERGFTDDRHWVRVELQLRDKLALNFASLPLDMSLSERFLSVLLNYLRFCVPDEEDSNKSRWLTADYWEDLCRSVRAVRIFTKPGMSYNMGALEDWVIRRNGNAIATMIECYGLATFMQKVRNRSTALTPRYQTLIDTFTGKLRMKAVRDSKVGFRGRVRVLPRLEEVYCAFCDSKKPRKEFSWWTETGGICRSCIRFVSSNERSSYGSYISYPHTSRSGIS